MDPTCWLGERMRRCVGCIAAQVLLCGVAWTQSFEVASVKPAAKQQGGRLRVFGRQRGGPGTSDPGQIQYSFMSLKALLITAYEVKDFQIAGPRWLDTERFDIVAKVPRNATKQQVRAMLQNLIVERFHLAIHRENRNQPGYWLTVADGGPKLKESAPADAMELETASPQHNTGPPPAPEIGPDGFPLLPRAMKNQTGMFAMLLMGRNRAIAHRQTMQDLAAWLSGQLNRPVTDHTGLEGKYDFILTFAAEPTGTDVPGPGGQTLFVLVNRGPASESDPDGQSLPGVSTAVREQLGLRLEARKGPVETIVVDHIEKSPTAN